MSPTASVIRPRASRLPWRRRGQRLPGGTLLFGLLVLQSPCCRTPARIRRSTSDLHPEATARRHQEAWRPPSGMRSPADQKSRELLRKAKPTKGRFQPLRNSLQIPGTDSPTAALPREEATAAFAVARKSRGAKGWSERSGHGSEQACVALSRRSCRRRSSSATSTDTRSEGVVIPLSPPAVRDTRRARRLRCL
jgi:hypothetical protein